MTRLAVLLYKYTSNPPAGMPGDWPAEIKELDVDAELPGPLWLWMTDEQLTAQRKTHQAAYDTYANAIRAQNDQMIALDAILERARRFGSALIVQTAKENVLMGITQAGKTRLVADYCQKLTYYLQTGSMYAALEEINDLINDPNRASKGMAPFITTERLNAAKAQIMVFLGM